MTKIQYSPPFTGNASQYLGGDGNFYDLPFNVNLFVYNTASDLGGAYKLLSSTAPTGAQQTKATTISANDSVLQEWVTGANPFAFLSNQVVHVHIHAAKTAGTKGATLYAKVYHRTSGGTETLLGTTNTVTLTGSNVAYDLAATVPDKSFASTDRFELNFYGSPTGSGTNPEITLYFEGTNDSRVEIGASLAGSGTGDVTGPASAVSGNIATFNGTSGKAIQDGGISSSTFAVAAKGVTNGDTHDHIGGDGAAIAEGALSLADNTTADASTSAHGFALKATAPAAGLVNVLGIGNGETVYSMKTLPLNASSALYYARTLSAQYSTSDTLNEATGNTEQNFATTYTFPANTIVTGKFFRAYFGFNYTAAATIPNFTLVIKLGGSTIFSTSAAAPAAATNKQIGLQLMICGTAAAGASAGVITTPTMMYVGATAYTVTNVTQPVNLATNGTLALTPHITFASTTATETMTLLQLVVEALN